MLRECLMKKGAPAFHICSDIFLSVHSRLIGKSKMFYTLSKKRQILSCCWWLLIGRRWYAAWSWQGLFIASADIDDRAAGSFDVLTGNGHSSNVVIFWNFIHNIQHKFFDNGTKCSGAGIFFQCFFCNCF